MNQKQSFEWIWQVWERNAPVSFFANVSYKGRSVYRILTRTQPYETRLFTFTSGAGMKCPVRTFNSCCLFSYSLSEPRAETHQDLTEIIICTWTLIDAKWSLDMTSHLICDFICWCVSDEMTFSPQARGRWDVFCKISYRCECVVCLYSNQAKQMWHMWSIISLAVLFFHIQNPSLCRNLWFYCCGVCWQWGIGCRTGDGIIIIMTRPSKLSKYIMTFLWIWRKCVCCHDTGNGC